MRFFSLLMILPRSGRIAWKLRSRPCLAEPPAESPSTMKSSQRSGSRELAVGELPRQAAARQGALAAHLARLARGLAGAGGGDRLVHDLPRVGRVLLEELGELRVHGRLDETARSAGCRAWPSSGPRTAGSCSLTEITAASPSRTSSPSRFSSFSLSSALSRAYLLSVARQRGAEPLHVRAALDRVDVVGEREHRLLVRGVPLHRHLDRSRASVSFSK